MRRFERLEPADLRPALAHLLATPGGSKASSRGAIAGFCDYLAQCPVRWEGLRCGSRTLPTGLFFALLLPGRTGIVLVPNPGEHGIDPADQLALTRAGLDELGRHRLHYAQVLLDPQASGQRTLVQQVGFRALTSLCYLSRDARYPWVEPPAAGEAEWLPYDVQTRPRFAETVLATYEQSLDCPELTGLRPIDDILAAHQAGGRFDPALWELAQRDGRIMGCLLLCHAAHGALLELVYMGVLPAWRRRGVGGLLLRRALQRARNAGAEQLSVVVDERNEPAQRLYTRFGCAPVARREAYLYRWLAADAPRAGSAGGANPVDNL